MLFIAHNHQTSLTVLGQCSSMLDMNRHTVHAPMQEAGPPPTWARVSADMASTCDACDQRGIYEQSEECSNDGSCDIKRQINPH